MIFLTKNILGAFLRIPIFFSFFVVLLILVGCSTKSEGGSAPKVRDHFVSYFKEDTCADARRAIMNVKDLDCDVSIGADSLRSVVNSYTRHELAHGHNFVIIKYMRELIELIEREEPTSVTDRKQLLSACIYMGAALQTIGMSSLSLDYYKKGLQSADGKDYQEYKAMLLNNIGVLYSEAKETSKASSYLNESLKCNTSANYNPGIFLNYINLAMVYDKEGKIDKALDASLKSMHYIVENEQPEDFYAAQLFLGQLYARQGQYDIAMSFLSNSLRQLEKIGYLPGVLDAYHQLSRAYSLRNMPDSANLFASRALKLSRSLDAHVGESASLTMLADVYENRGDYERATHLLQGAVRLDDSLRTEENRLRLLQWEGLEGEMTSGASTGWIGNKDFTIWICLAGVVLAGVAIVYLVLYYKSRRILLSRGEEYAEASRKLSEEVDLRNRELTTLSLEKIKSREGISNLCDELREVILELNPKATSQKMRLKGVLGKLDSMTTDMSDDFRQSFERVHPDFYRVVKDRYPTLTPKEERLCAFIYLGLSTKEIAALTWREIRSVESSRNRLRKKLQLSLNDDLFEHLRSIAP